MRRGRTNPTPSNLRCVKSPRIGIRPSTVQSLKKADAKPFHFSTSFFGGAPNVGAILNSNRPEAEFFEACEFSHQKPALFAELFAGTNAAVVIYIPSRLTISLQISAGSARPACAASTISFATISVSGSSRRFTPILRKTSW